MQHIESAISQIFTHENHGILFSIILALLIIVAGFLITTAGSKLIEVLLKKKLGYQQTASEIITIFKVICWSIILLLLFYDFDSNSVVFIIFLVLMTVFLFFAVKDIIRSVFGGIHIIFMKIIKQGDYIKINHFEGRVETIRLRRTWLRGDDNCRISIPNHLFLDFGVTVLDHAEGRKRFVIKLYTTPTSELLTLQEDMIQFIRVNKYVDINLPHEVNFHSVPGTGHPLVEVYISVYGVSNVYESVLRNELIARFYEITEK